MDTLNRERCIALRAHGCECHLLYLQAGSGLQNIRDIPVHITDDDQAITALLAANRYHAIIVTSHYLMLPRLRKLGYSGPLIYEVQGLGTVETANQVLAGASGIITAHADAAICPVTRHLVNLLQHYLPELPVYSFHNCIHADRFCYQKQPSLAAGSTIIGWVGRIEANKNWRQLLEIFYWLRRHVSSLALWLFVDDTLSAEQQEFDLLAEQLELKSALKLHANIAHKHMAGYYSRMADSGGFLLSTSITEGFGYAVAEAMCCRLPVLASDSDGISSMLVHNQTGCRYEGASDAVAQGLKLLADSKLRQRLAENAERHMRKHFAPDQYAKQFMRMLHDLHR